MSDRLLSIAARCWLSGGDTMDISTETKMPEATVYRLLWRIKDRAYYFREAMELA